MPDPFSPLRENGVQPGVYNIDYYTGSQVAVYIGDILIDEVTSISYSVQQNRVPLYGYGDQLFRDVSKGQVLVQGQFTINFKEAGYLYLVLDKYRERVSGKPSHIGNKLQPFKSSDLVADRNIERLINGELTVLQRNSLMQDLASTQNDIFEKGKISSKITNNNEIYGSSVLSGFSSNDRANSTNGVGSAEGLFEKFEDYIWKTNDPIAQDQEHRRADDTELNPFDIFIGYGDFAGDNTVNHTIRKITGVHILGQAQQIAVEGGVIMESYSFIARNII